MPTSIELTSPLWAFIFVLVTSALLTAAGLAAGYAAEAFWHPRGRKVFDLPLRPGQARTERIGTLWFHVVFVPLCTLALATGRLRFKSLDAGLSADDVLSFAVPWYAFTLFYYVFHRAMHRPSLFWMHRWHHVSLVTTPMAGFSMHPVEALGWTFGMLAPAIGLAALERLTAGGFAFFIAVFWVGNIAGHANAELFPLRSTRLSTWLSNPVSYHSLHHARMLGHYGFVAAFMDRLFGTEFADWQQVHAKVYGGSPLRALNERVTDGPHAPLRTDSSTHG